MDQKAAEREGNHDAPAHTLGVVCRAFAHIGMKNAGPSFHVTRLLSVHAAPAKRVMRKRRKEPHKKQRNKQNVICIQRASEHSSLPLKAAFLSEL